MSKIGDLLNKDVGSIATKVLKADVADIVKGAGRALNTDVGSIAKGAGKVLTYDLTDLFANNDPEPAAATPSGAEQPEGQPTNDRPASAQPAATAPAANGIDAAGPASTAAFVPVARDSSATTAAPSAADAGALPKARLTEALVNRQSLAAPSGADLLTLLPLRVGAYERAKANAQGDIASDPVSVTYSGNAESVTVTLYSCWDADEAIEKLTRGKNTLENSRGSMEQAWVAGINSRGVVFIWVRGSYCYEVLSPRGVSAIARFLGEFIY
jgi:hypothetical protein